MSLVSNLPFKTPFELSYIHMTHLSENFLFVATDEC